MSGNPPDPNDPNRQGQYPPRQWSGNPPDPNDPNRQGQYPPRWNPGQPDNHYPPGQYPPPDPNDPNRQGQYPPPPRQWSHSQPDNHYPPGQYPPPSQWNMAQPENPPTPQYPPPPQYPYPPTSYPPASYPPASYPPASYPPPPVPDQHYQPPPHAQYPPPPNMAMHPPVSQDPYRLPPIPPSYRPEMYAQPHPAQQGPVFTQAAPRQRTAIACGYCRKRKIRCSGFENSHDGRCSNCMRFNQQCLFTPVSSQTQAFVPAHAAYPHLRNSQGRQGQQPVMLYGAQGQPLPAHQQPHPAEQTLPPPHGMYTSPINPMQDPAQRMAGGRPSGAGYDYPDPTNLAPVTPAASAAGNQNHTPSPHNYPPPPPPNSNRTPQQFVPDDGRNSSSPHNSPYPPMHPTQTPPPPSMANSVSSARSGMNVNDMLNPGDHGKDGAPDQPRPSSTDQSDPRSDQNQGRSSTDSDMLNALNRRGLDRK